MSQDRLEEGFTEAHDQCMQAHIHSISLSRGSYDIDDEHSDTTSSKKQLIERVASGMKSLASTRRNFNIR